MSEAYCKYYVHTARGQRCAFIGVREWRLTSEKYLEFCKKGGAGCPVLASINARVASHVNGFLKVGENVLFKEG
ncbi:hypothetical protein [Thermofilum pendens]|uniref:hypothetical protein n=1 Tax=Thermofilum pendens TaxID=2269 RepID=UPI000322C00B|nr:hypothetical protein [Thermofilum pendens]